MNCSGQLSCLCRKCEMAYEKMKLDNEREFDRLVASPADESSTKASIGEPWLVTHQIFQSIGDYLFGPRKN